MGELKVNIGAFSLTGESAHSKLADTLAGVPFPLRVKLLNLLNRRLALPEIDVGLAPFASPGDEAEATINSLDLLLRAVSTLEQIAESHRAGLAVTLTVALDAPPAAKADAPTPARRGKGKPDAPDTLSPDPQTEQ